MPDKIHPTPPRRSLFAVWRWPRWKLAAVILLLLAASWGMSYAMLAERGFQFREIDGLPPTYTCSVIFHCPRLNALPRNVQVAMQFAFYPVHLIDRQLRPGYWNLTYEEILVESGLSGGP